MEGGAGLSHVRVVEVGRSIAASAAGKLLADLGATVIKVEPPAGDPTRRLGPRAPDAAAEAPGGAFLYLNTNKRSVVLELDTGSGREQLACLAERAHLLLHDQAPGELEALGLGYGELSERNPALVLVSITPFGMTGPLRDAPASDLTLMHGSGQAWLCPDDPQPPERPPIRLHGSHAAMQAGLHAAVVGLAAVFDARRTGLGEHVDLATFDVLAGMLGRHFVSHTYSERVEDRLTPNLVAPATFYPCSDGWVFIIAVEQDQWERLLELMGTPAWALGPQFGSTSLRGEPQSMAAINAGLAEWSGGWETEALFHACQARRIGATPVYTAQRMARDIHLTERGFFREAPSPTAPSPTAPSPTAPSSTGRPLLVPGAPYRLQPEWWALRSPAPELGEALCDPGALLPVPFPAATATATAAAPARPLEGVRVLDLSWVWAGPYATQLLGYLGAEIIKVENSRRPDLARRVALFPPGMEPGLNRSGYFNQVGQEKESIAVNLGVPEGVALVRQLAARSDVVVSNFATGVMERLGLGADLLRGSSPELIVAELSAFGQTGPYRNYVGYGPAMVPLAGLAAATGYADEGVPRNMRIAYADPNAGVYLAFAILAALEARRERGGGQAIEASLWESLVCTGFEGTMAEALGAAPATPIGNHDALHAPHNVYRCRGEDEWLAVAVTDDDQWQRLCALLELSDATRGAWAADPGLTHREGRKAREAELDVVLSAWCAERDKTAAGLQLQAAGVPAFPSLRNVELASHPQLQARGMLVRHDHPEVGRLLHLGVPWQMALRPTGVRRRAPLLGEHTDDVLQRLLGLDAAERERLRRAGAIE